MVNPVIYNTHLPIWHLDPWDMEFQTPLPTALTLREKVAGLVWGENKSKSLDQQEQDMRTPD